MAKYIPFLLLVVLLSCETKKKIVGDNGYLTPIWIGEFKEYGDVYLENCEDSCWIVKRHPSHDGICYLVALTIFDSCGRVIAYGCTDGKVLDTMYHRCEPCDSAYYKYAFKENNFDKYILDKLNKPTNHD